MGNQFVVHTQLMRAAEEVINVTTVPTLQRIKGKKSVYVWKYLPRLLITLHDSVRDLGAVFSC